MNRPKTAGESREEELKANAKRELAKATDPVEKLRYYCLSRGVNGLLGMGRMFRRMDDNGNKTLGLDEFFKGVKETGLDITLEDCKGLFARFDRDQTGSISVDEFLIGIRV